VISAPVPAPAKFRTMAGLIDCAIVAGYVVVLGMLIAIVFPLLTGPTPLWAGAMLALLFIEIPVGVWWCRQESFTGTTIGKRIEGLRVVQMGTDERASTLRCVVRVIAKILPWAGVHVLILIAAQAATEDTWWFVMTLLALFATAGILSIAVSYIRIDRRTGYDLISGTQVVLD